MDFRCANERKGFIRNLLLIVFLIIPEWANASGRIALTFDDAPRPDGHYFKGTKRTRVLIEVLKKARISRTIFFCNTVRFDKSGKDRIRKYADAGHLIANHTHSHPDLHQVGSKVFIEEIERAHPILEVFKNFTPLFRFPFLREGKTKEERDEVRRALGSLGYQNGYVTVDNYDWYMDRIFQATLETGKRVNLKALRKTYISILWEGIQFYDKLAIRTLGRSPNHVLLLHENDLAALFVVDLVEFLRAQGWEIISVVEAYKDPISVVEPDTLILGQGRVMGIASASGYKGPFASPWESEAVIEDIFQKEGVFEAAIRRRSGIVSPGEEQ